MASARPDDDLVLTRILWLEGDEEHNANTRDRYIYIHGTNHEGLIGQPASHGCVRMRNSDMIELYDLSPARRSRADRRNVATAVTNGGRKFLANPVAKSLAIGQSLLRRRPAENGGELKNNMKTIKSLALVGLRGGRHERPQRCAAKGIGQLLGCVGVDHHHEQQVTCRSAAVPAFNGRGAPLPRRKQTSTGSGRSE